MTNEVLMYKNEMLNQIALDKTRERYQAFDSKELTTESVIMFGAYMFELGIEVGKLWHQNK